MAATAGSVAVGSTIGHGLSSMLFGGSSSAAPAQEAQAVPVQQQQSTYQAQGISCEVQARGMSLQFGLRWHHLTIDSSDFTKCLEKADLPSCTWYLEQLKAVRKFRSVCIIRALILAVVPSRCCSLLDGASYGHVISNC